jgi:hypothetical protein
MNVLAAISPTSRVTREPGDEAGVGDALEVTVPIQRLIEFDAKR